MTPRSPAPMPASSSEQAGGPIMVQEFHDDPTRTPDAREPRQRTGVEVSYSGDVPTVVVTGIVDRARVTEVSATIWNLIASGVTEVGVDLTHSCDGAALLTVLARTRADLAEHGGTLWLIGVAVPEFLAALIVAPLEEVFLVYDAVRRDTEGPRARRGRASGSNPRRTDWPHPTRTTGSPRALRAVADWWTGPTVGGAHRAR